MHKSKIQATGYIMAFVIAIGITMAINEAMPTYNIGDVYIASLIEPEFDNPYVTTFDVYTKVTITDIKNDYCQYDETKLDITTMTEVTHVKSMKCSELRSRYIHVPFEHIQQLTMSANCNTEELNLFIKLLNQKYNQVN